MRSFCTSDERQSGGHHIKKAIAKIEVLTQQVIRLEAICRGPAKRLSANPMESMAAKHAYMSGRHT
jgi:hypothetical protein